MILWLWHTIEWTWGGPDHPGATNAYAFFSGPLGDLSILGAGLGLYWHHTCHVGRCFRLGRHHVEGTPYTTCRKHHPSVPTKRVTAQHIRNQYKPS